MRDTNDRPVCHRAEDLVSYLYGEANPSEALDFGTHLQTCDACRSEFAVFNQVHDSIQVWRNEALGASLDRVQVVTPAIETTHVRQQPKVSALTALREFFSVSPLWLRGATAFAALLLCALSVMMFMRVGTGPVPIANNNGPNKLYTQRELQDRVNQAVEQARADLIAKQADATTITKPSELKQPNKQIQVVRNASREFRPRGLNRQEREQLAADLRLTTPVDEDELLAFPEQDKPRQ